MRIGKVGRASGVVVTALLASGCVTVQRNVSTDMKVDPALGYVAGSFASVQGSGFAFVLTDARGEDRTFTFGVGLVGSSTDVTGMIAVPPGDYRISNWLTFNRLTREQSDRKPVPDGHRLGRPFHVDAGHVVFVGSFDATSNTTVTGRGYLTQWRIAPRSIRADDVVSLMNKGFPSFGEATIECLLCVAPAPDAVAFAAPAHPASDRYGRPVTLHYHRRDGRYDGWGLYAYESFEAPEDLRAPHGGRKIQTRDAVGYSFAMPVAPTGVDASGAYWVIPAANFGNGRVNFVLFRDRVQGEGYEPRFWLLGDSPEGWVNSGDSTVYLTGQDAEQAQQR